MNLTNQRRMAASLLKCGVHRVWIDPNRTEDVAEAITRADVRTQIASGAIVKLPARGVSRSRAKVRAAQRAKGRRRGPGSRKGASGARDPPKARWIRTVRPLRRLLRELRDQGKLPRHTYRVLYRQVKGGMFKSRAHLEQHLRTQRLLKEGT